MPRCGQPDSPPVSQLRPHHRHIPPTTVSGGPDSGTHVAIPVASGVPAVFVLEMSEKGHDLLEKEAFVTQYPSLWASLKVQGSHHPQHEASLACF